MSPVAAPAQKTPPRPQRLGRPRPCSPAAAVAAVAAAAGATAGLAVTGLATALMLVEPPSESLGAKNKPPTPTIVRATATRARTSPTELLPTNPNPIEDPLPR